jgi:hypothetical protein
MRQGRASRDGSYSWKVEPKARAKVPAGVAQLGQRQGNHVTTQGSTEYGGVDMAGGKGYEPPKGPAAQSGVGGGRDIHRAGSQGRR